MMPRLAPENDLCSVALAVVVSKDVVNTKNAVLFIVIILPKIWPGAMQPKLCYILRRPPKSVHPASCSWILTHRP